MVKGFYVYADYRDYVMFIPARIRELLRERERKREREKESKLQSA